MAQTGNKRTSAVVFAVDLAPWLSCCDLFAVRAGGPLTRTRPSPSLHVISLSDRVAEPQPTGAYTLQAKKFLPTKFKFNIDEPEVRITRGWHASLGRRKYSTIP